MAKINNKILTNFDLKGDLPKYKPQLENLDKKKKKE